MTGATILNEEKGGFVNLGGMLIHLLRQLARINRDQKVFSIHSGREIPREFGIEGIADDNLLGPIRSTLLKV